MAEYFTLKRKKRMKNCAKDRAYYLSELVGKITQKDLRIIK